MSATIHDFPQNRTCRLCMHFLAYGEESTISGLCFMFDKSVQDVHEVASRCNAYEPWEVDRGEGQ